MGQPGSSVIAFLRHNLQSSVSGISSGLCVRGTRPSQSARRVGAPTPVVALAIKRPGQPPLIEGTHYFHHLKADREKGVKGWGTRLKHSE